MAYVSISVALLGRVNDKIHTMRQVEIKSLGEEPKVSLSSANPFVHRTLWGEHLHLMNLLPDTWINEVEKFSIRIKTPESKDRPFLSTVHISNGKAIANPAHAYYGSVYDVDHTAPELMLMLEYATKVRDTDKRWDDVKDKVIGYLKNCKSLNEAVKTWPDVKYYIHKDDMDRLGFKREASGKSTSAADALADMNVDELVGAAVIARMSGAV
jgi:hypothetical protein